MESGKSDVEAQTRLIHLVDGMRRRFGEQLRRELGDHPYTDVRRSELRLLLLIPECGANLTALADLTGVTKQSLSEFVEQLRDAGYVVSDVDRHDRRVKLIRPTTRGEMARRHILEASRTVEDAWRESVGSARFESMKETLAELGAIDVVTPADHRRMAVADGDEPHA